MFKNKCVSGIMDIIGVLSIVGTAIGVSGTAIWTFLKKTNNLEDKIEKNRGYFKESFEKQDKKINLVGQGVQAIMQEHPKLDSSRFKEALEENGVCVDDFIREETEDSKIFG